MRKIIPLCLAILLVLIAGGPVYAQAANRIVAIVNNEIITYHELEKALRNLPPADREKDNREALEKQVLLQMIDQKIVDIQVKKLGIRVPPEEVNSALTRVKEEQGAVRPEDFSALLAREGLTEEEFRNKIKEQILRFRLISREIGSKIIIPEERVKEFYEKNKQKFLRNEGVHLAQILLALSENASEAETAGQKKKADDLYDRLQKGEDFAQLARKYSQDPTAAQGGDLGVFKPEEIDPTLREIIAGLEPGGVSPVLKSSQGFQIVKLVDRQQAKEFTFEEVKERIEEQLFQEEINVRFGQWLQQIKDRSYIQILL
jgi:peptidyl-prolyl cis-trans isomerase SurA